MCNSGMFSRQKSELPNLNPAEWTNAQMILSYDRLLISSRILDAFS